MGVSGIGLEVIDVAAFLAQLDTDGSRFTMEAFTVAEREHAGESDPTRAQRLAARLAAKLAFLQAVSKSCMLDSSALDSADLSEVEVVNDTYGRPSLRVSGQLEVLVRARLGNDWVAHVSLTHDGPTAAAVVVLESP
ncbi:phosphopantetheine--protein transferase [Actinobacteria bacterium IMCC26207]|nr:phosphopantetheine--protein transferase [Actinobacteria bacterium IMCC26207]